MAVKQTKHHVIIGSADASMDKTIAAIRYAEWIVPRIKRGTFTVQAAVEVIKNHEMYKALTGDNLKWAEENTLQIVQGIHDGTYTHDEDFMYIQKIFV